MKLYAYRDINGRTEVEFLDTEAINEAWKRRFIGAIEVTEPGEKKVEHTVWVNIYRQSDGSLASSHPFASEHIAKKDRWEGAIGTFPVHMPIDQSKKTVTKEAEAIRRQWDDSKPTTHCYVSLPLDAKNIKCTYEVEE